MASWNPNYQAPNLTGGPSGSFLAGRSRASQMPGGGTADPGATVSAMGAERAAKERADADRAMAKTYADAQQGVANTQAGAQRDVAGINANAFRDATQMNTSAALAARGMDNAMGMAGMAARAYEAPAAEAFQNSSLHLQAQRDRDASTRGWANTAISGLGALTGVVGAFRNQQAG